MPYLDDFRKVADQLTNIDLLSDSEVDIQALGVQTKGWKDRKKVYREISRMIGRGELHRAQSWVDLVKFIFPSGRKAKQFMAQILLGYIEEASKLLSQLDPLDAHMAVEVLNKALEIDPNSEEAKRLLDLAGQLIDPESRINFLRGLIWQQLKTENNDPAGVIGFVEELARLAPGSHYDVVVRPALRREVESATYRNDAGREKELGNYRLAFYYLSLAMQYNNNDKTRDLQKEILPKLTVLDIALVEATFEYQQAYAS